MSQAEDGQRTLPVRDGKPQIAGPEPTPSDPTKPSNVDELLAELNRVPLFMTSLDETNNTELDALKALQYEGTKYEVANNFREQGNECARAKKWTDAREFYTQALDVLQGRAKKAEEPKDALAGDEKLKAKLEDVGEREVDWLDGGDDEEGGKVVDLEEAERKERECEELCCANRALCNLEIKNYGMAVRDCTRALIINPGNSKALFRSASALLALDKTKEALSATSIGISNARRKGDKASEASFEALQKRAHDRAAYIAKLAEEREQREKRQQQRETTLAVALKQRGVVTKQTTGDKPDLEDAEVALEDPTNASSELRTPVLLLYPTAGQSELIKAVREGETMEDLLAMVLPAPFEEGGSSFGGPDGSKVDCFVETGTGGLRKVGKRVAWGKVIEKGGAVLKDGLIQVYVVPKDKVETWIAEWKKRNGR